MVICGKVIVLLQGPGSQLTPKKRTSSNAKGKVCSELGQNIGENKTPLLTACCFSHEASNCLTADGLKMICHPFFRGRLRLVPGRLAQTCHWVCFSVSSHEGGDGSYRHCVLIRHEDLDISISFWRLASLLCNDPSPIVHVMSLSRGSLLEPQQ